MNVRNTFGSQAEGLFQVNSKAELKLCREPSSWNSVLQTRGFVRSWIGFSISLHFCVSSKNSFPPPPLLPPDIFQLQAVCFYFGKVFWSFICQPKQQIRLDWPLSLEANANESVQASLTFHFLQRFFLFLRFFILGLLGVESHDKMHGVLEGLDRLLARLTHILSGELEKKKDLILF